MWAKTKLQLLHYQKSISLHQLFEWTQHLCKYAGILPKRYKNCLVDSLDLTVEISALTQFFSILLRLALCLLGDFTRMVSLFENSKITALKADLFQNKVNVYSNVVYMRTHVRPCLLRHLCLFAPPNVQLNTRQYILF